MAKFSSLSYGLTGIVFFFYREWMDIPLYFKRKKWIGKDVYGTCVLGEWKEWNETDSGIVKNVYRTYNGLIPGYVYMIDNGKDQYEVRTLYVRDKKDGVPW